jgi:hypothetical protein
MKSRGAPDSYNDSQPFHTSHQARIKHSISFRKLCLEIRVHDTLAERRSFLQFLDAGIEILLQ